MSINKLQAALAHATNEFTLTAANLNFDFSIVKCEAPKEYQILGNALSRYKREAAENGNAHTTARRLGALFDGVCPPTPKLLKAYGIRVSEIAEIATKEEKKDNGIFAAHTGVDGTSIWASATSSVAALQLQLLACMLAKVWKPTQATSIWYELVKERRKEIASKYENGEEMQFKSMTAAAQSEISRESLAEWDASARAWLRVADRVKGREQTKLRLVLGDVNTVVDDDKNVFSSVMKTWRAAVVSMENLLSGMPQGTESGPALLALSSWHLYPNILVASHGIKEALFADPLIPPGAKFTIGLTPSPSQTRDQGVYWSLCLQHLQSYGRPVQTQTCLNRDMSNITFQEFSQGVLGCVLGNWELQGSELRKACEIIVLLQEAIESDIKSEENKDESPMSLTKGLVHDKRHWWHLIARAACAYCDHHEDVTEKVIRLGLRRSAQFLPRGDAQKLFGLLNAETIVRCVNTPENRVRFLRRMAEKNSWRSYNIQNHPIIIRYATPHSLNKVLGHLATAIPVMATSRKRKRHDTQEIEWTHRRWMHPEDSLPSENEETYAVRENREFGMYEGRIHNVLTRESYVAVYGCKDVAAIYQKVEAPSFGIQEPTFEDIKWLLEENMLDMDAFVHHLQMLSPLSRLIRTMKALEFAGTIYQAVDSVTVCVEAFNQPIFDSKWAKALLTPAHFDAFTRNHLKPATLSREIAFSCVTYLGCSTDIEPSLLKDVFAMAHEDSLYLASQLTCDPFESVNPYELQRILGNVGRAGITMLVPPKDPIVRQVDASSWKVISNTRFDGQQLDCLSKTSLHLSFTDYCVPLYQATEHGRDHSVFFLESVVSIHDSEAWVGDIDILKALNGSFVTPMHGFHCGHREPGIDDSSMISVNGWPDILDPPPETFVVRSHGNWVGRLAAASLLSQTLPRENLSLISVCPEFVCWRCNSNTEVVQQFTNDMRLPEPVRAFIY
ncbi:hypothetical protein IQ07DRAFT_559746 [Pyrenochaeta sp. DS3sAY3a]|nr:hypothetical protein IQ07DRAFT_559746 [Pyrenochaeta sp. DS3sAY3a]